VDECAERSQPVGAHGVPRRRGISGLVLGGLQPIGATANGCYAQGGSAEGYRDGDVALLGCCLRHERWREGMAQIWGGGAAIRGREDGVVRWVSEMALPSMAEGGQGLGDATEGFAVGGRGQARIGGLRHWRIWRGKG